ncbi:MAG: DNA-directed RNA polymerase subunit beta, partial [Phycisphaerae bacterium]
MIKPFIPEKIRSFSKLGDVIPIPNLIQIQTESYKRFLQQNIAPEQRRVQGLEALLREIFPITSYDENIELRYLDYSLGKPRYTPDECRQLRLTYGMPLRIRCQLHRKDIDTIREERIYLGDVPIMVGGGEFIINGAERVIVSQLHRSPGVDFVVESSEGDRPLHACRIIPERGSWIEINVTRKDLLAVRIDQSSKIPATLFLRAFDPRFGSDGAIIRSFYDTKKVRVSALKPDMYAVEDVAGPEEDAEPLVRAGCPLGDAVGRIQESGLKQLEVIEKVMDPLILNTIVEDNSHSHEDALMKLYQRLRPGNPVQLDKAVKLFHEKFYDANRYRLGKVGRFRINRKFGLAIPSTVHTLTVVDLFACLRFLLDLRSQNQVGQSIVRNIPFELCLMDEITHLSEQIRSYQLPNRKPTDGKTSELGALDGIRQGRRKLSPTILVEEIRRQARAIADTPTEWAPPDSLNVEWFRKVLGRSETDRASDILKASKDFVVSVIRTRAERIFAATGKYMKELERSDRDVAQLEYMNYFPQVGPLYSFTESEAHRLSATIETDTKARWKELFGAEKQMAFSNPQEINLVLEKHRFEGENFDRGATPDFGFGTTRVVVTEDDIDHLGNRRMRTIDELASDEMRKGFLKLRRTVQERMSIKDPDTLTKIAELINTKAVSGAMEFFFGRGELSQVVDQTNPLSQLTHERRLSALGPGGLNRKRAGFEVRDVHISHYGRICPIETPEGTNIGLIASLSIYASVDEYGFLVTPYRKVEKPGEVNGHVEYLRADEEMKSILAPPNVLDRQRKNKIRAEQVIARSRGELHTVDGKQVEYVDISPKQIVGVSAALIPFLEHDDANRALMGSNMQRQAVPLLVVQPPIVGTGMERIVAANSGMVVRAAADGKVTFVDAARIVLDETEEYPLRKFHGLNERTCLNQRPLVRIGQEVKKSQIIADGPACYNGELALGRNVLVAFMTFDGYNFEDAILISEKLVKDDTFSSIHIDSYEVEIRETKLGKEEFTRDIPNVSERMLRNLDEHGVVCVGTPVGQGDILVGKVSPKSKSELSPEEKLLHAIFGRAGEDVKNDSLEVPSGESGIVIDTKRFSRRANMSDEQKKLLQQRIKVVRDEADARSITLFKKMIAEIESITKQEVIDPNTRQKVAKSDNPSVVIEQIGSPDQWAFDLKWVKPADARVKVRPIYDQYWPRIVEIVEERERKAAQLKRGDELASGVLEMVKVYVATKRSLSVGDKMAGRHGNKGVIAKILPEEDMPYLADGTSVDILLNPLGVPSRMNVGQILETHLGWAAQILGFQALTPVFDGTTESEIHVAVSEANERVRQRREEPETIARAGDTGELLVEMPYGGKITLHDGRTGEELDQKVTVGFIYMMKLHHLVDDKIHARSTGPYSLITQQPLGGKARTGGQRFGEMEVWGLEAYGAAYNLQELLTVKSDDVEGRTK